VTWSLLPQDLRECCPKLSVAKSEEYAPYLEEAMKDGQIDPVFRASVFLAQIGHESADLATWVEIGGDRKPYAPFYGRGPIQLTGVSNYRKCGDSLMLPLVVEPDLVLQPRIGFEVAVWFWRTTGLNLLCSKMEQQYSGDLAAVRPTFDTISRRINGQAATQSSLDDRWRRFQTCFRVMSTPTVVA